MINFKTIIRIIGILLLLETVMLLACSAISYYYNDEALLDFWKSAGITAGVGLLMLSPEKVVRNNLPAATVTSWSALPGWLFLFFGMLPFYISGYVPDITNAFF